MKATKKILPKQEPKQPATLADVARALAVSTFFFQLVEGCLDSEDRFARAILLSVLDAGGVALDEASRALDRITQQEG